MFGKRRDPRKHGAPNRHIHFARHTPYNPVIRPHARSSRVARVNIPNAPGEDFLMDMVTDPVRQAIQENLLSVPRGKDFIAHRQNVNPHKRIITTVNGSNPVYLPMDLRGVPLGDAMRHADNRLQRMDDIRPPAQTKFHVPINRTNPILVHANMARNDRVDASCMRTDDEMRHHTEQLPTGASTDGMLLDRSSANRWQETRHIARSVHNREDTYAVSTMDRPVHRKTISVVDLQRGRDAVNAQCNHAGADQGGVLTMRSGHATVNLKNEHHVNPNSATLAPHAGAMFANLSVQHSRITPMRMTNMASARPGLSTGGRMPIAMPRAVDKKNPQLQHGQPFQSHVARIQPLVFPRPDTQAVQTPLTREMRSTTANATSTLGPCNRDSEMQHQSGLLIHGAPMAAHTQMHIDVQNQLRESTHMGSKREAHTAAVVLPVQVVAPDTHEQHLTRVVTVDRPSSGDTATPLLTRESTRTGPARMTNTNTIRSSYSRSVIPSDFAVRRHDPCTERTGAAACDDDVCSVYSIS